VPAALGALDHSWAAGLFPVAAPKAFLVFLNAAWA